MTRMYYDLNLLPNEQKRVLRDLAVTRIVVRISLRIALLTVLALAITASANRYFNVRIDGALQELDEIKRSKPGTQLPVTEVIKTLNSETLLLQPLFKDRPADAIIEAVTQAVPIGVSITTISYSSKTNDVTVNAIAKSRTDIPDFERAIRALPIVTSVSLVSSITERTNIPMTLTAHTAPFEHKQQ